jgi:transporter family-2 protein
MTPALVSAIAVAFLGGALLSVQICANRRLGASMGGDFGDMLWSAVTSFVVGLVALIACCLVLGRPAHVGAAAERAPWWAWCGGLMGAFYVAATIILLPRLGALLLVGVVVGGQVLASLAIDHFGLLGVEQHALSPMRIVGAALLVVGVALALKG